MKYHVASFAMVSKMVEMWAPCTFDFLAQNMTSKKARTSDARTLSVSQI